LRFPNKTLKKIILNENIFILDKKQLLEIFKKIFFLNTKKQIKVQENKQ
jgi:hypothetical protein